MWRHLLLLPLIVCISSAIQHSMLHRLHKRSPWSKSDRTRTKFLKGGVPVQPKINTQSTKQVSSEGDTQRLLTVWDAKEKELEDFYASNPDNDLEPDPHTDLQEQFNTVSKKVTPNSAVRVEKLEKQSTSDRQTWKVKQEKKSKLLKKTLPYRNKKNNKNNEESDETETGKGKKKNKKKEKSVENDLKEVEDEVPDVVENLETEVEREKGIFARLLDNFIDKVSSAFQTSPERRKRQAKSPVDNGKNNNNNDDNKKNNNNNRNGTKQDEGYEFTAPPGTDDNNDGTEESKKPPRKNKNKDRQSKCPEETRGNKNKKPKKNKNKTNQDETLSSLNETLASVERRKRSAHRKKRAVVKDESRRWTFGIVPYTIDPDLSESKKREIRRAMNTFERFTCIRFVPWVNYTTHTTNDLLDLGHPGFLRFIVNDGCWSYLGNQMWSDGQAIACACGGISCVHEIGHAVGFHHEHQSPLRGGWIRINPENVQSNQLWQFAMKSLDETVTSGYDLTSLMHYGPWGYSTGGDTMTLLYPELFFYGKNSYYLFMETADTHNCAAMNCSDFAMTCLNDGYVTLVDGVCACRCPDGLDPSTGCATILKAAPAVSTFPAGQFGLPMPKEGVCPDSSFNEGNRVHHGDGVNQVENFMLNGQITDVTAEHYFCVSDGTGGVADVKWPIGSYCIYRKGDACPDDFYPGSIQYSDTPYPDLSSSVSGELPDGVFNSSITRLEFCCREDGFASDSMLLPTNQPFATFMFGSECQTIFGMREELGKFSFDNNNNGDVPPSVEGDTPISYINRDKLYYWTKHCHYTPVNMDCGEVIELSETNPTAVISSQSAADRECNWLIKAPENDNILITFSEFDVAGTMKGCEDSLEIRYVKMGQPGMLYCGERLYQSIRSIYNSMMLTFRTVGASSSFTANVTVIDDADSCYLLSDQGNTYGGYVNYTHDFKPCLHWAEVQHCPHHKLAYVDLNDNLEENFCRNPGDGAMPWCYTKADGCERNYCDVCAVEPPYNVYTDCDEMKAEGYCYSSSEALTNCPKACREELHVTEPAVPVSSVFCGTPEPLPDGSLISANLSIYAVGEVVTYECDTSPSTVDRTCLTTGQWSDVDLACRECPDGWFEYDGNCYGYLEIRDYYAAAVETCALYNGVVATTKDAEENAFVQKMRDVNAPGTNIWLGMTDELVEGEWVWADQEQVTWSNWQDGQPDNYYDAEHCAYMNADGLWNDVYCAAYYKPAVVCKAPVFETTCQDVWSECPDLFYDDPTICTTHSDVTKKMCKFTCGYCEPFACDVEPATDNATLVSNVTSLDLGGYVTYECQDGYFYSSGDFNRGCQWCNLLTGDPLVCVGVEQTVTVMSSAPLIRRNHVPDTNRAITGDNDNFRITRHGRVVAWEFYSNYAGDVAFQVWRPSPDNGANYFEFVGLNKVYTRDDRLMTVNVPESETFPVQPGDIIGVYYATQKGGIAFDWCDANERPEAGGVTWLVTPLPTADEFEAGTVYEFGKYFGCRLFSFRAHIGPL